MFPKLMVVPLHFTVEFLGFLVAAGAALLVLSRPSLVPGPGFNRIATALGFGALAAAEVLHGGAFEIEGIVSGQFDGDRLVIAVRALGFAFILIGVVGGLRYSGAGAPALFEVQEPLAFAPAAAAFLLGALSLSASLKGGARELRRLSLGAFLFAAAEVLTAAAPRARFGIGVPDPLATGAHALKALAFVAVAAWLWSGVRLSIRSRFVASFVALLVAVVLALSVALTGVISRNVEEAELARVGDQVEATIKTITGEQSEVLTAAKLTAGAPLVIETLARDRDEASEAASFVREELEPFEDLVIVLMSPSGRYLGASGNAPRKRPGAAPRELTQRDILGIVGSQVVLEVVEGRSTQAASVDSVGDSAAVVAAREVRLDDRVVGIVAAARFIDALAMEDISTAVSPAVACLVVGDEVSACQLEGRPRARQVVPVTVLGRLATDPTVTEQQRIGSHTYYSGFRYLTSSNGTPIGTLVISSPARLVAATRQGVTRTLFLVAMAVAVIALALAWLSGRRITRPIQGLTDTARAVREGDLTAQADIVGGDEVGQLGETFNEMTASLYRMTNDLRNAARQEHDLRARIETIIQSMADGLVAVDRDGRILAFNREAEQLTGIKAASALGKSVDRILDARDAEGNEVALPISSLSEGSLSGVFLRRRAGDSVPVAFTSAVLRAEDGQVAGAVAVMRDMTREREIERIKSEFLSNISHELRTPLTPIKGYAEILERKDVPPEKAKRFVKGILDSTQRLERIVELLVDFAAMEAGRLAPKTGSVDLGKLVHKLAAEWEERTPRHTIKATVRARLPKIVGDERLIRRSLEEIVDNAVKFSPKGGTIHLEAKRVSGNGRARRFVEVTVSDEGIGIPPEDLPKIFSDFHQLDGSETRAYGGLGLGLAFVHRIVEAHEGSVMAESEPDHGTRMKVVLPAATGRQRLKN